MKHIGNHLKRAIRLIEDGFLALPKWVARDRELSPGAKLVFSVLWTRKNADNIAWPGQAYISGLTGFSERQVRRYIKELVEAEFVKSNRTGKRRTNRYELVMLVDKMLKTDAQDVDEQIVTGQM